MRVEEQAKLAFDQSDTPANATLRLYRMSQDIQEPFPAALASTLICGVLIVLIHGVAASKALVSEIDTL